MSQVTLKQIAAAAQTDTGTVSRVLSGGYRKARISEIRANEIRLIAERLKWRPNVAARSTRTGRFNSIALVSSTHLPNYHYLSPAFLNALHDEAHRRDHLLNIVRLSPAQIDGEERAKVLEEVSVDGWVLNFNLALPAALRRQVDSLRIPAVLINNGSRHDAVCPDDLLAARQLTERLIRGGCRRILYFDSEQGLSTYGSAGTHFSVPHRQQGYEAAMRDAGLEATVVRPPTSVPRIKAAGFAAETIARHPEADAIVSYNPQQAQVLLMFAERAGKRVPEDLLIATFNDMPVGATGLPVLTAVMRWDRLAHDAIDMLMAKIDNPQKRIPSRVVAYDIDVPPAAELCFSNASDSHSG